jgi:hypothetical protein
VRRNKVTTLSRIAFVIAVTGSSVALAQPPTAPREPLRDTVYFVANAAPPPPFGGPFQVVGFAGEVPGAVVADKPYAADSVTESTQVLADGNRITARNEARFARDSKGRTRREQTLRGFGPASGTREPITIVSINDPVAGVSYSLDVVARTAQPSRPLKMATGVAGTFTAPAPPSLPPGAAVRTATIVANEGAGARTMMVGGGAAPAVPADFGLQPPIFGPTGTLPSLVLASTFDGPVVSPHLTTEDLGQQVLEGVLARGTRRTQAIPAGAVGNERPIEIVAEQWYSPDLDAVVQSRNFDPRAGETVYRLVNVVRGEQPPDLFAVPQGYTVLPEQRIEFAQGGGGAVLRVEKGTAAGRN